MVGDKRLEDSDIYVLHAIAKERRLEIGSISWGGFYMIGDGRSIDEVNRLLMCEARLKSLEAGLNEGKQ